MNKTFADRISAIMRGLDPETALPALKRRPQWEYDVEETLRNELKKQQKRKGKSR